MIYCSSHVEKEKEHEVGGIMGNETHVFDSSYAFGWVENMIGLKAHGASCGKEVI